MRLWTLHPKYLDSRGLVAGWREALLAQKVLAGRTRGYRNHPQLERFRAQPEPLAAIAVFLAGLADEARRRGYHFDRRKIGRRRLRGQIEETDGQMLHEWRHLQEKLSARAPELHRSHAAVAMPEPHPLFRIVSGEMREWEKGVMKG